LYRIIFILLPKTAECRAVVNNKETSTTTTGSRMWLTGPQGLQANRLIKAHFYYDHSAGAAGWLVVAQTNGQTNQQPTNPLA